jgi:hypothetical protein
VRSRCYDCSVIHDPSPQRVSTCPVHFIWDGRGVGRIFVRVGFLGFLVAGGAFTGAMSLRIDALRSFGLVVVAVAAASWGLGQLLSFVAARRALPAAR